MAKTATRMSGARTTMVRLGIAAALAAVPLAATVDAQAAPAEKGNHQLKLPTTGGASAEVNDGTATSTTGGIQPLVSTSLSSGTLYFWSENGAGYGQSYYSALTAIQYKKNSGGQILARFAYEEGGNTHWDQGAFYQNAGETKSFSWGFAPLPANCSAIGKMWVSGQQTFQTPPDHPC
ncbi:hypothetical protein [Kitasatospora terrestris]|uniref:Secreted protein n=1 Tax=Kitasatospora terrestris TaxID=258051 RepID=A0ABP9DVF5_9ACTN